LNIFYEQLPFCDVADVFRFVNCKCRFLSALTPLQPRYAKKVADADSLMAIIITQAMNHGNLVMARTSDIPYHLLEATYQQYLRQASLHDSGAARAWSPNIETLYLHAENLYGYGSLDDALATLNETALADILESWFVSILNRGSVTDSDEIRWQTGLSFVVFISIYDHLSMLPCSASSQ